jgi:sulfonate transport system permease protein
VAGLQATGLGQLLGRSQDDVPTLVAVVGVIVVLGVAVEYLVFVPIDRRIRGRRGLIVAG